jgi:uncharacterized protein (UPF0332 family)
VRSLLFKKGYREESHIALKFAFKELYVDNGLLPKEIYKTLDRSMSLREMADYKNSYSNVGAENIIAGTEKALQKIKILLNS